MHHRHMKHLLVVLGVLVGAIVCYATGFGLGIGLLFVAGAVLELAFWILVLTSSAGSLAPKVTVTNEAVTNSTFLLRNRSK